MIAGGLSAAAMVSLWESVDGFHPIDRALALLDAVDDGADGELATLPVGRRDALLLELRRRTFGDRVRGFADCPSCAEPLELELSTAELIEATVAPLPSPLTMQEWSVALRLPDSRDLAAAASVADPSAQRQLLIERCLHDPRHHGAPIATAALPADVIAAAGDALEAADPLADLHLDLECPDCGHGWRASFDVEDFLWLELHGAVRRLLRQVHDLARHYGWRESDILAMSPKRRQAYLGLAYG